MAEETAKLVSDATRGDATAVERLLETYLPDLHRYVRRHAGGVVGERESSSDLVQSVCREVLEQLADERFEYRGEAQFRQWLYNAALLKVRGRRRFWHAQKREAGREVAAEAADSPSRQEAFFRTLTTPSQQAGLAEELERARELFGRLPERYRRVIELAEFEGLPHREVGARLGITEGASRVLLSRALARLATLGAERGA